MAKTKREPELAKRPPASGIQPRTVKLIAAATDGRRKPAELITR